HGVHVADVRAGLSIALQEREAFEVGVLDILAAILGRIAELVRVAKPMDPQDYVVEDADGSQRLPTLDGLGARTFAEPSGRQNGKQETAAGARAEPTAGVRQRRPRIATPGEWAAPLGLRHAAESRSGEAERSWPKR